MYDGRLFQAAGLMLSQLAENVANFIMPKEQLYSVLCDYVAFFHVDIYGADTLVQYSMCNLFHTWHEICSVHFV